jgi:hypothetical protein
MIKRIMRAIREWFTAKTNKRDKGHKKEQGDMRQREETRQRQQLLLRRMRLLELELQIQEVRE